MSKRRVVVTGMGMLSPVGNTVAESWESIINGRSGIGEITRFDTEGFGVKIGGQISNLDITDYIEKKEARIQEFVSEILQQYPPNAIASK